LGRGERSDCSDRWLSGFAISGLRKRHISKRFQAGGDYRLILLGFGVTGAAWGWVLAIVLMPFLALYFLERKVFSVLSPEVRAVPKDFCDTGAIVELWIRRKQRG